MTIESDRPAASTAPPILVDPAAAAPGFGRLTRDSAIYGIGTFSGKALGLLLLPILTRALSRPDYGVLDVLWSLGTGLAGILVLGLDAAVVRLYFDQSITIRASLIATWRAILLVTAAATAVVLLGLSPAIAAWVSGSTSDTTAPAVLALVVPATLINYFVVTILRTLGRPVGYAIVTVATFVLYGGAVVGLAVLGRASVAATMAAWGIALAATSILGFWSLRGVDVGSVHRDAAARLLRYGLPLAPALAVTLASDFVHRAILLEAADATEVAHLTVALRFASVLALAVAAFQLAWQPRIFAMGTSPLALQRIALDMRRFVVLSAVASLVLTASLPAVIPIAAGAPYAVAVPTAGWCIAAALLGGVFAMAITGTTIAKRPGDVTKATVLGIVVAVGANLMLAAPFGSVGTAVALVIGQAVAAAAAIILARGALMLPGPWLMSGIVVVTASVASVAWTQPDLPLAIRAGAGAVAAAALIADPTFRDAVGRVAVRLRIQRGPTPGSGSEDSRPDIGHG